MLNQIKCIEKEKKFALSKEDLVVFINKFLHKITVKLFYRKIAYFYAIIKIFLKMLSRLQSSFKK